jgi:segregation and condensation protein B
MVNDAKIVAFQAAAWAQLQLSSAELGNAFLKGTLEALLFAANGPLTSRELARTTRSRRATVEALLAELMQEYADRGIQLRETRGGFTFLTNPTFAGKVRDAAGHKPVRLTRAQLETLAIIAYRQPVTRPEIDDVRGVDSGPVLRTLSERELIRVIGKKEEPGRPLLYGTTDAFLVLLGLRSLADLPTLREFTELSSDSRATYERRLGETAPAGAIVFDDEPDAPIDPTVDDEAVSPDAGAAPSDEVAEPRASSATLSDDDDGLSDEDSGDDDDADEGDEGDEGDDDEDEDADEGDDSEPGDDEDDDEDEDADEDDDAASARDSAATRDPGKSRRAP